MRKMARFQAALSAVLSLTSGAFAQYHATFEAPAFGASAAGQTLNFQDGFYQPTFGAVDGACFTYVDNSLGVVANPDGGGQFVACTRGSSEVARTQRDVDLSVSNCIFIEFDFNISYVGTLPTANYPGSVSLQPHPGSGSIIVLFNWDDVDSAENFSIRVIGFDAAGNVPFIGGLPVANNAFRGLLANHWYRLSMRIEYLPSNALTGLSIRDLDTVTTSGFNPANLEGFHLGGGAAGGIPGAPRATAIRFLGGGGHPGEHFAGNILAVDNLHVTRAEDRPCFADLDLNNVIDIQDLANLLANFGRLGDATYFDGDLDCDRDVDIDDLALLLSQFGIFC